MNNIKSMTIFIVLLFVPSLFIKHKVSAASKYRIVCYYGSWAAYRTGNGNFEPSNLDPSICTHGIYSFAKLDESTNTIASFDPNIDITRNGYRQFTNLVQKNPSFRALLAIGGWSEGSVKYSNMVSNPSARATFVRSVPPFLKQYGFHGLDVDWEFPTERGGRPEDKQNFATLIQELKKELTKSGLLLSAAVNGGKYITDKAYDVPKLNQYLDFINLMTYDYHGTWESFTGHNAPLYASASETGNEKLINVDFSITYWIKLGASPTKITLGIPLYGHSYTLASTSSNGPKAPTTGPGNAGPITKNPGSLSYMEVCSMLRQGGWNKRRDDKAMVPYTYKGNQWVSYDDKQSVKVKSNYIKDHKLGGAMVWSVESDDFRGTCGEGVNPLLSTIKQTLT